MMNALTDLSHMRSCSPSQEAPLYRFDAFISYAGSDHTDVAKLVKRLEEDGFTVWFDVDRMEGGPPVLGQIADAIAASAHTVVCLSDAYLERKWTAFELQSSMHRDPSSSSARTILVRLRPLTRNLPNYVQHLLVCDLTDERNYDREYRRIKATIERPIEEAADPVDVDSILQVCEAPFRHLGEPPVALFLMRRATECLSKFLYRQKIGEIPHGATFDRIIGDLVADRRIPIHLNASLVTMQMYSDFAVRDQLDDFLISNESIEPALSALRNLVEWTFPGRSQSHDPLAAVLQSLPRAGPGDLLLPGTRYSIHAEQMGRNGLGPLFAGRDCDRDVSVSVNLVNLSEDREAAFFEEVSRFIRLRNANIVSPSETGRVVVDGRRRCLYLVTPRLDGISAQDLVEHTGPLPPRAAYEVGIGIGQALAAFHASDPPIVHGDIKPANVLVSGIGAVRVLCIGREPVTMPGTSSDKIDSFLFSSAEQRTGASLTLSTDLSALHSVLSFLLSGEYRQQNAPEHAPVLRRIADCDSAAAAVLVLEQAVAGLPSTPSLGTVNRQLRRDLGLDPVVEAPSRSLANQDLALVGVGQDREPRGVARRRRADAVVGARDRHAGRHRRFGRGVARQPSGDRAEGGLRRGRSARRRWLGRRGAATSSMARSSRRPISTARWGTSRSCPRGWLPVPGRTSFGSFRRRASRSSSSVCRRACTGSRQPEVPTGSRWRASQAGWRRTSVAPGTTTCLTSARLPTWPTRAPCWLR